MKLDNVWRRRGTAHLAGCYLALTIWAVAMTSGTLAAGPLGPSERPEAYFNGTSYIRLSRPISLKQLVGLSFRTCVGGELFSQRFERYTLYVTALFEQVVVSWALPTQPHREVALAKETLDNRWHWVALRYRTDPPSLLLEVDKDIQVISNLTWNPELLTPGALESGGALVLVGSQFSGCIHEGPQLEFFAAHAQHRNVEFSNCPLTTDACKDRKDVLRVPPKDHCYNEPCMRHGTCISRHDRYECHCSARYTGNNCEVDAGEPCASAPCYNGARCAEDARGDFTCYCVPPFHGTYCEMELSPHPLCKGDPCRNNGSCSVPPGAETYVCACPLGYSGTHCEVDVDECLAAGSEACLNGGRCQDAINTYICNCTGTGYTGARCETNVNECLEEPNVCGHGVCYDKYGSFVCSCLPGYAGERCDRMSACVLGPCGAGGVCMEEEGGGGFHCVCARGTLPPLCTPAPLPAPLSAPPPPPAPLPAPAPAPASCAPACPPRSYCAPAGSSSVVAGVVVAKQVMCFCDVGFYGAPGLSPNCSSLEDACEAGACLNGASCARGPDHINCTCAPGYKGTYCELQSTAGAGVLAGPGAGVAGGKALSDLKVERCSALPCLHAKACVDLPGTFHCECEAGWSGQRCEVAAPTPEPDAGVGVVAGAGAGEACAARACFNAGSCRASPDGPLCECRPGFGGALCELLLDCRAASCPHNQECVEQGAGAGAGGGGGGLWRCAPPASDSACASSPCHNGTCLALDTGIFHCQCMPGYTGRVCESDINECASKQKLCNHGVCINVPGSYQCYCKPGYTGDSCEQDIDECLSSPCKNGGTCHNLENNYECTCMEGFEGKDCGVNINDCEGNPCAAGSTCLDGIASYSCVCQDGITGANCEIDINDCESQPCQHGGRCIDGQNSFTCDCSDTGYSGDDCSVNVDECAPQPCRHGGTCIDDVNDYHCTCYPAYTGKNCEIDINECESEPCKFGGVCLEHSNTSLYRSDSAPVQVGPQPQMLLPSFFYQPFSLENASGLECVCPLGTSGARCEVNLDECAPAPCGHGSCEDGVGGYTCHCAAGYEGDHCEIEIDECLRYEPCAHGKCFDGRATYYCSCSAGWGGRNCSVVLEGCRGEPCRNHGTCLPWLQHEVDHRFNCTCAPGYYGTTCEKITTMSMEKNSYVQVNTSREEGYEMSFRFKTSLGNGLLAMGRGFTYFFLELSSGRLNLHSSLLNKWGGVFIGSSLNDSKWQKVFVTINSSHLVLAANEEQTIYPISQNEANNNSSVTSFPSTRLGNAGSSIARLTHGPNYFVGCFQDVVVNGQWILPEDSNATHRDGSTEEPEPEPGWEAESSEEVGVVVGQARAVLSGVLAACPRSPQCQPNPCRSGGACEDAWSSFLCTCPRPHLGYTCQYSYTPATFGQESAKPRSVVTVQVSEQARRAVHAALDISMFIRTRKPTGQIFYLGSLPRYGQKEETQVGASLEGGELLVHLQFNQTPENYTVGGTRLDNGHLHLIEVVRNSTLVQVKLNGTEYFRKSISAAKQLDAQVLYLGGPPPAPEPPEEALPSAAALVSPPAVPAPVPIVPIVPIVPAPVSAPVPIVPAPVSPAAPLGPLATQSPVGAAPTFAPTPAPTPAPTTQTPPPTTTERQIDDSAYFKGVIQDVQISNGVNVTIVEFFPLQVPGLQLPLPFGEVSLEPAGVLQGVVSDDACASRPCLHNATCSNTWNDFTCVCPRGYKGKQCAEVEFCQLQSCPSNSHCRNLDNGYECVSNATFDGVNTTLRYRLRVPRALPPAASRPDLPDSLTLTYRSKTGGTLLEATGEAGWFSVGVFRSQVAVQWRLGAGAGAGVGAGAGAGVGAGAGGGAGPATRRMRARDPHHGWTTLRLTFSDEHITGAFIEADGHEEVGLSARLDVSAWQRVMLEGDIYLGGGRRANTTAASPPPQEPSAPATRLAMSNTESITDSNVWEYTEGDEFTGDNLAGEYFKGCLGAVHVGSLLLPFFTEEKLFVGPAAELLAAQPHYALLSGRPWGASEDVGCMLCLEQDCERGGHCADVRSSYQCTCQPGYTGDYCQIDIDECLTNQCQNGATCKDGVATYTCICPEGYDGELCENDIDECLSGPCMHDGTCRDLAGGYSCVCGPEWRGPRCEVPHSRACHHLPCADQRARCRDVPPDPPTGNNFTCECFEGYEGVYCEFAFCDLNPCVHGTCINDTNPPRCHCSAGYAGARCDVERDQCAEPGACLHGGRCLRAAAGAGYLCDCAGTGWTGARCELDVDECAAGLVSCGPGDCLNLNGSFTCICAPGFCGVECALLDPCFAASEGAGAGAGAGAGGGVGTSPAPARAGPCRHGAACSQRCTARTDYVCHCVDGWAGKNCTQQAVPLDAEGQAEADSESAASAVPRSSSVLIGVGAALVALALGGGALAALGAQARRKRATRGTYSPSGQEYCNPRAEMMHNALKPPPEERLI